MKTVFFTCLLLLLAVGSARPDTTDTVSPVADTVRTDTLRADSVRFPESSPVKVDSVLFVPTLDQSPEKQVNNPVDFEEHLTQNPTRALFKSMLLPGWGQLGNRRYVKAGVIIALESWLIGSAVYYGIEAADYNDKYKQALELADKRFYYSLYEENRSSRNKYTWFAAITVFVSMFDAYVDAHLSGSPFNDNNHRLKVDIVPDTRGGASAVVSFSF
ncbi:MAG: DUF5683 domain-containing protein [Candidatus Zixiibacteriota bacterium]